MKQDLVESSKGLNFPLTPISFLERAATLYGDKVSIIYNDHVRFSWRETYERCLKLASSLVNLGISNGDIVATLAPNIPAHYELHFGVPMAGAIISALNTKLDATTLALILEQLEHCKIIFVDYEFIDTALKATEIISQRKSKPPLIVLIQDYDQLVKDIPQGTLIYNELLEKGQSDFNISMPSNECDPISVNYTSGSTGIPKGAVYSHRSVYLNSFAMITRFDVNHMPVFLWTVDMFRCNGWCFIWSMPALGGTNIFLRNNFSARDIFDAIHVHKVTHLCGAPTLLEIIANCGIIKPFSHKVCVTVAGILPSFKIINKVTELGFDVNIGYGMTEALGPVIVRKWKQNFDDDVTKLNYFEQKGVIEFMVVEVDVKDPNSMKSVPYDGKTIGEIMFKGNTLMSGYLKSSQVSDEAFRDGWYRTRDLGVKLPNGSFNLKDRAKDIIYSKGEFVSSLEVEAVLLNHPMVLKAAVVGRYDDGSPCAIVKLKDGYSANVEDIIKFCEDQLDAHMVPKSVVFDDLPLNSTGKVQKFVIREKIKSNGWCETIT
ncbi:putative acyl-activating enzyme 1, peroxisomal [Trifolium repens]|nr:putative acyl-activating enzyme 1, peroxisomal [Trifolium repens]